MACDSDEFEENIENLKATVRKSFALMYASLKARELKTLRQLDAIRKQCEDNKDLERNCVQNIKIDYSNESTLLEYIGNYGVIDFERLCFDSNTFIIEDYISPNDDHMYSYKTIEEITENENIKDLEAIEEAALKQITKTEDCVCYVSVKSGEVSRKFRDLKTVVNTLETSKNNVEDMDEEFKDAECLENVMEDDKSLENVTEDDKSLENVTEDDKSECSDPEVKKINPTDDWLKSIKNQTETEPSQVTDVMEHSTIACS